MVDYKNKAAQYLLERTIFDKCNKQLELSFTAHCDKACYYCYLKQFGDQLYPNAKTETILENLKLILDYADKEKYKFSRLNLFTGEFFNLPYWREVFNIILQSDFDGYNEVTIPTNFSFVDKGLVEDVHDYKMKFQQKGKDLLLSCSIDGADDYETRPNKDGSHTNINNVLDAIEYLEAGMHPMISPEFVKNYKKNIDFWIDVACRFNRMPMFLEVRNEFWNYFALENLAQCMWYLAEQMYIKVLHKDNELFTRTMFALDNESRRYNCFLLRFPVQLQRMSCAFQSTVSIRVPDLMLIPCHRLSYEQFNYGQFVKDGDSLKLVSKNLDFHSSTVTFNPSSFLPKCANCDLRMFCIKGCLGAQFETNKDPFMPIDSVCALEKRKYLTIHKIAQKYGLYDIFFSDPTISPELETNVRYVISVLNKLEQEECR